MRYLTPTTARPSRRTCALLAPIFFLLLLVGCHHAAPPPTTLYQESTITALLEGVYQGDVSLADLRSHGDFGIGTFDGVDGEMILLGGSFFQVRGDGKVYHPPLTTRSPFATVTSTPTTPARKFNAPLSYPQLLAALDQMRRSSNSPYAILVEGDFDLVLTRSVPRQTPPYRRLVEVTQTQPTFELRNAHGTLVGFWVPPYLQQLNVPGYHLHFLADDRSAGGHVLECRPRQVSVRVQQLQEITLHLPQTQSFHSAQLGQDRSRELRAVEQATTQPAAK